MLVEAVYRPEKTTVSVKSSVNEEAAGGPKILQIITRYEIHLKLDVVYT